MFVAVAVVLVVVVVVPPVRTFLAQDATVDQTRAEVAQLTAENRALAERASQLRSDAGVERVAHEEYGLVRPGEKLEVPLPSPTTVPAPPPPAPEDDDNLLERVWETVTGLF